jgi:hypothetical protein
MLRAPLGPWLRTTSVRRPPYARSRRPATALFAASARAVLGRAVDVPLLAALALTAATWPVLDSYGPQVLIAVAVVLAFALISAIDDPEGPVLDATPYSPTRRSLFRVGAAGAAVVPVWLVAAVAVAWRTDRVSIPVLGLQTAALWAVGVAVAVGVRRVSASVSPSYVSTPVLLSVTLALDALPRGWQMFDAQAWGPPWIATQLRWLAVLAVAVALVTLLLRDAMDHHPRATRQRAAPQPRRADRCTAGQ